MSAGAVLVGTAFAVVVIAAATVTVAVRDARLAVIGLLVALLAAPFLADPMADLRGITARLAGAALGAYPLWMIYRGGQEATAGSRGGVVIDGIVAVVAALAAASAAIGWDVAASLGTVTGGGLATQLGTVGTSLARPFLPAIAAGGALVVLAVSPVTFARDPLRLTIGLTVGLLGVTLVWTGLSGPPTPFTDLCIAIALAAVSGGGAVVIAASRRDSKPLPASAGLRPLPPLHLPHRPDRTSRGRTDRTDARRRRGAGQRVDDGAAAPGEEVLDAPGADPGAPTQEGLVEATQEGLVETTQEPLVEEGPGGSRPPEDPVR